MKQGDVRALQGHFLCQTGVCCFGDLEGGGRTCTLSWDSALATPADLLPSLLSCFLIVIGLILNDLGMAKVDDLEVQGPQIDSIHGGSRPLVRAFPGSNGVKRPQT
jgi:hypothetical protein